MSEKHTVASLAERVAQLEAQLASLTTKHVASHKPTLAETHPGDRYPYTDARGRRFRVEGSARCFPPSN